MARTSKLTSELIEQICAFIENGNTNKDACYMVGISEATLYNWIAKASKLKKQTPDNAIYFELLESLKRAEARFRAYHISVINNASRRNWQASAWMLERRYPNEYGRKVTDVSLAVTDEVPVRVYLPDNGRDKITT